MEMFAERSENAFLLSVREPTFHSQRLNLVLKNGFDVVKLVLLHCFFYFKSTFSLISTDKSSL